jgi:D-arginine dehydrogenase
MPAPTIAVVGGGILGCLIAREISTRRPAAAVILLDRDAVGSGASRRSAGLHIPYGATERVRRMAAYSQEYYENLKQTRPALPLLPLGMTIVAAESSALRLEQGYLEGSLTRVGRVPGGTVTIPPGAGAWNVEGCQHADVGGLAEALARELRPGVSVREGVRVTGIEPTHDGVTVYLGTGGNLTVDQVVLAPGPWLGDPAWSKLVAPLGVRVKKVVALHIEQIPDEHDQVAFFPDEDAFLLPLVQRGHWLMSHTCQEWDVDPDTLHEGVSAADLDQAHECLRRYAPSLVGHCISGRVFCDAYSPHREPVVQTLDPAGRIVFAGAANGSGYRLAPAVAAQAADLLDLPARPGAAGDHQRVRGLSQ